MNNATYIGIAVTMVAVGVAARARRKCFDVPEGFYGLLYLHGRSLHRLSPGRHWFWKRGYTVHLVDMRKATLEITHQSVLSADQVGLRVGAVMTYQIIQAETATHAVRDYAEYLRHTMQLAIRSVIGATPMEQLLHQHLDIGADLLERVKPAADVIGIVVYSVELKEVTLAADLKAAAR